MRTGDYDKDTRLTSIGEGLGNLLGRLDPTGEKYHIQAGAASAWREVAGPTVAAHATAIYVRKREMVIELDSNTWAQELSMLADRYREAVNKKLGDEVVESVRFTVRRQRRF